MHHLGEFAALRITRPHSQPNWNLLRESSIDHDTLVRISTPWSMPAMSSSSVDAPGSTLRLAMRSMGGRFQEQARVLATPAMPARAWRDGAAQRALEDALADEVLALGGQPVVVPAVAGELLRRAWDRR